MAQNAADESVYSLATVQAIRLRESEYTFGTYILQSCEIKLESEFFNLFYAVTDDPEKGEERPSTHTDNLFYTFHESLFLEGFYDPYMGDTLDASST